MSKVGLCTKEEAKFFGSIIAGEIPVGGMWKPMVKWALPAIIDTADDKLGDKIPEPWQSSIETLITKVYEALKDGDLSQEDEAILLEYCATIMNERIDIPLFDEDDEAIIFVSGMRFAASLIRKAINNKKK